ncbi:NAD(P)-binding domain-containing protein [Staphylococcus borealis]|uniref:NAD(P)-binding domain-containing protein n=1 Tax=Staphylococcus borealis TaxID=2742203 RepID=UPI0025A0DBA5|nr:NAD(P)-binding domain-containing protein [Staphylococcus borealis]MDM7881763.1 NAD(P)-binding domain-containing protein [Staphylococcus borealis]
MHWTIIGGGIQGTTIAIQLRALGLSQDDLSIIDPYSSLCEQFNDFSHRISMPYLRSPIVHHIHPNPFHLKQFAKMQQYTHATYGQYQRPQTDMFMHHVHEQVHHYDLNESHIQGYVKSLARNDEQWQIQLNHNQVIHSDCVILANGCTHQPYIPDIYQHVDNACHIFDTSFNSSMYEQSSHVVGSGISAAHLTLKLINQSHDKVVHLWMNKDIDIQHFDADPGWLGPKNMSRFLNIDSSIERMSIIQQERHKGSMPRELYLRLKKHVQSGRLIIHKDTIESVDQHHIHTQHSTEPYDFILLATGFKSTLLQQPMIQSLITNEHAPLTHCGFPSISTELEWLPQLFVSGGLADLELGPFARNIMGGREAAQRIKQAYQRLSDQHIQKHS